MRTNKTFGDIYKESDDKDSNRVNKDSKRVSKVGLKEAKEGLNSKDKDQLDDEVYTEVREAIDEEVEAEEIRGRSGPDNRYLASLQVKLTRKSLKYGSGVLDTLKTDLKNHFSEDQKKRTRVDAWIAGVKSVHKYVSDRREELDDSEIVDSYEISFNVTLDVKHGVDVVERMLLEKPGGDKSEEGRYADQIHLVQIKTSENNDDDEQGPDGYYEDHRDLVVQDMKNKDYLLGSLLKEKGKEGLGIEGGDDVAELLEPGIENHSELISKVMTDALDQLVKKREMKDHISDEDLEEFIRDLFVSIFWDEDPIEDDQPEHLDGSKDDQSGRGLEHRYFKKFCALIKSGSFRPYKILKSAVKPHINFPAATEERQAVMKSILDPLRSKERELEEMFEVKDYAVFSGYYVKNKDENQRKQRKIVNRRGNEVFVQAIRIKEDKVADLYDRYGLPRG